MSRVKRVFTVVLLVLAACRNEKPASRFVNAPVILISIDTLRSDHLPVYGYHGVETPGLDRFRRDAILFRSAWSHCPMTLPSHLSMLTGLLPPEHGVRDNVGFRFDSSKHESLPSLLRTNGYAAGAAVSSYVLRGGSGLADAFDFYDDALDIHPEARFVDYQRSGFVTEPIAERWIDQHSASPFFFFFHIYEPHVPYDPPEPFRSRYANRYDGEIATADAIVGRLLDHLRASRVYDRAIIIITSDHGEGLGDHGEQQHSILIYREAIQVPLLVKLPHAQLAGRTVDAPAQLIDLFPTVTSLLGIETHEKHSGSSLVSLVDSPAPWRSVYSESLYPRLHFGWSALRSLTDGRMQLIESASQAELYELASDRAELKDVVSSRRRELASLREALARYPSPKAVASNVDPQEAAKLAALGYVGSVRAHADGTVNPRERIGVVEELRVAMEAPPQQAAVSLHELAGRHPDMIEVWLQLGDLLSSQGRYAEAIDAYKGAMAHSSVLSIEALLGLGEAYLQQNDLADVEKCASLAMAPSPREAHLMLARVALARNDLDAAQHQTEAAAGNDPQPSDLVLMADIAARHGAFQQALDLLDRAGRRASESGVAKVYRLDAVRADILGRTGHPAEAIETYEREIANFPRDLHAYANLAVLHFVSGNRAAMETTLTRMVAANPTSAAQRLAQKTREALK
jgi:arylsulfatase A-like enzyme/lipopolysaccharide biosynthesis regulator YciM